MENKDLNSIKETLTSILNAHVGALKVTTDKAEKFEVTGTIEAMQGKKKVPGMYFATVLPKPKDIRFYFFPIYTHKDELPALSPAMQKALKGKSCFHIKSITPEFTEEMRALVAAAVEVYQKHGLLA